MNIVTASDFVMLSNQNVVMMPLQTFCAINDVKFTKYNFEYSIVKDKQQLSFRLFDKSLKINNNIIIVNTPPILLNNITFIPFQTFARLFNNNFEIITNGNFDTDFDKYERSNNDNLIPPSKKILKLVNDNIVNSLYFHGIIQYLDLGSVAKNYCAISVFSDSSDIFNYLNKQFFPLNKDMFIVKDYKIIWSGNGSSLGDIVSAPKVINIKNNYLINFVSFISGAGISGIHYYLLKIEGNNVKSIFPKNENYLSFYVAPVIGDVGIYLSSNAILINLITYETELSDDNEENIRYLLTWYRWEDGKFVLQRKCKTTITKNLQIILKLYNINGVKIFDLYQTLKEMPL